MSMAVLTSPGTFRSPTDQIPNSMSGAPPEGEAPVIPAPRPGMGSLCIMMDFVIQKSFTDLQQIAELLPSKTDMEKKITIAEYLNRTRLLFSRLLALVRVSSNASQMVEKSYDIIDLLEEQKFYLVDMANNLTFTARDILSSSRLPNFCVTLATDILVNKRYSRLPTCLKDKVVLQTKIPRDEMLNILPDLNKIIYTRLTGSQIPPKMSLLSVKNGYVTFIVPGEFKIRMTLMSMDPQHPWRILGIDMLIEDIELNCKQKKIPTPHALFLQERVQSRIMEKNFDSRTPLIHVYDMIHTFALSMKLDVLHIQCHRFIKFHHYEYLLSIDKYVPGSYLTFSYWKPLSKPIVNRKSQVYSICVYLEPETSAITPTLFSLRVKHSPTLLAATELSANAIKGGLSIKHLLTTTIQSRIKYILKSLQYELMSLVPGSVECQDFPLTLIIPLLNPCHVKEKLRLHIDTFTGSFLVNLPGVEWQELPHLNLLRDTLNESQPDVTVKSRLSRIAVHFNCIRLWLCMRRVRHTLQCHHSPVQTHSKLSLWLNEEEVSKRVAELLKNHPNHLFVRTLPNSDNFLLIIPECSCEYEARYRVYFLITRPCNSAGQFPDSQIPSKSAPPPRPVKSCLWRRPVNLRAFTVYHRPEFQSLFIDRGTQLMLENSFNPQPINLRESRKRRLCRAISHLRAANESEDTVSPSKRIRPIGDDSDDILLAKDLLVIIEKFENIDWINTLLWSLNDSGIEFECNKDSGSTGSGVGVIKIVKIPLPCNLNATTGSPDDLTTKFECCHLSIQQNCSPRAIQVHWLFTDNVLTNQSADASNTKLFECLSINCATDIAASVNRVISSWHAMCHMHAAWMKTDSNVFDNVNVQLVAFDLKTLRFKYGPNLIYQCNVEHCGEMGYSVHLSSYEKNHNPHVIMNKYLSSLLNKSASFNKLIQTMVETLEFLTAISSIKSSFSVVQSDKMNSCYSVRNITVTAVSTHSILLVYRGQLAIKVSLKSAPNCSAQFIKIEDHGRQVISNKTKTIFRPCPAFQIFHTSLQDAFQMDIEEEVWPGMTVGQFSQLIGVSPQLGVSPLESYLAGALFFITASYSVLYGNSNKEHVSKDSVDSTSSGRILRAHAREHPILYRSYGFNLALCARRIGVELSLWRLEFDLTVPDDDTQITDPLLRSQLCSTFKEYFDQKVFAAPFIPSAVVSFIHLLTLPPTALLDIVEIMRWELHPQECPPPATPLSVRLVMVDCLSAPGQCSLFQKTISSSSQSSSSSTKTTQEIQLQLALGDFNKSHYYSFHLIYNRTFNTVDFQAPVDLLKNAWRIPKDHWKVFFDLSKLDAVKKANQYAGPQNRGVSPILTYLKAVLEANPQIL